MRLFAGWTFDARADGSWLEAPGGRGAGWVRVRRHRRPHAEPGEILARAAAELGGGVSAVERMVTIEGEHAVVAAVGGAQTVAAVLGDDHHTLIQAYHPAEEARAMVRELARVTCLGLGELRRRRYLYAAPPWDTIDGPDVTEHRHELGAVIRVARARPCGALEDLIECSQHAVPGPPVAGTRSLKLDSGLEGTLLQLAGEMRSVDLITLSDGRFTYPLRLESDRAGYAAAAAALVTLLRSIVPIPRALATPSGPALFSAWAA